MRPATKHALLDALLTNGKLRNDGELAVKLEASRDTLSRVRNRHIEVPDHLRIAIQRHFGWSLARIERLVEEAKAPSLDKLAPPAKEKA